VLVDADVLIAARDELSRGQLRERAHRAETRRSYVWRPKFSC
jgi:hypothetical protein